MVKVLREEKRIYVVVYNYFTKDGKRVKRKVLLLVTSCALILGMAGCSISNKGKNVETRYFSQNIEGDKEYIGDTNEDVLEILVFIEKFVDSYLVLYKCR